MKMLTTCCGCAVCVNKSEEEKKRRVVWRRDDRLCRRVEERVSLMRRVRLGGACDRDEGIKRHVPEIKKKKTKGRL